MLWLAVGGLLLPRRSLAAAGGVQYGRAAMWVQRRQSATRAFLVLAVLLASVWIGGQAAPAAGQPVNHLTASRSLPGVEPAVLPDRVPALGAPVERPGQSGRLVPVLLGILATGLAVGSGVGGGRLRSGLAAVRSLVRLAQRAALAPPSLQSA
jgi:hypothetical protein